MAKTVKVRFLRPYKVKDDEGREFEAGQECDLTPDSAEHFVKRGAAEVVEAGKAPAKPKNDESDKTK